MSHFASEFDRALDGNLDEDDRNEQPVRRDQIGPRQNRPDHGRQPRQQINHQSDRRSAGQNTDRRHGQNPDRRDRQQLGRSSRRKPRLVVDLDTSTDSVRTGDGPHFMNFTNSFSQRAAMRETITSNPQSPQPVHPDIAHPNIAHPNIAHPNIVHPNIVHPNIAHPNIVHPNIVHPEPNITYSDPLRVRRLERVEPAEVSLTNTFAPAPRSESDRFTLGPSMFSYNGDGSEGTTTGFNAAVNSQFLPRRKRNRVIDDEIPQIAASDRFEALGDGLDSNDRILDNISDGQSVHNGNSASQNRQSQRQQQQQKHASQRASQRASQSLHDQRRKSQNGEENMVSNSAVNVPSPLTSSAGSPAPQTTTRYQERFRMPGIPELDEIETSRIDSESRPRDPHEQDEPVIFRVPIDEVFFEFDVTDEIDQGYLEQQLEWSESESEEESDSGSIAEMLDDSTDESYSEDDAESRLPEKVSEREWQPRTDTEGQSDGSDVSDDDGQLEASTESESDFADSDFETPSTVADERRRREKRHRVPTLHYWDGERIEYVPEGKLGSLTAVDVRRVIPAVKTYRPRRMNPRRKAFRAADIVSAVPSSDGTDAAASGRDADTAALEHEDVRVPVFDPRDRQWHTEIVAKSMVSTGFEPLIDEHGSIVPLVYRSNPFGNVRDDAPFNIYMSRIAKGGIYTRMLENSRSSSYLGWSGKCTVQLNTERFDSPKGIAVFAPPANDSYIDNGSDQNEGDETTTSPSMPKEVDASTLNKDMVTLLVIEFDGSLSQEAVHAMARGAASMISSQANNTMPPQESSEISKNSVEEHKEEAPDNDDYAMNEQASFDFGEKQDVTPKVSPLSSPKKPVRTNGSEEESLDTFAISFANAMGNPELESRERALRSRERRAPARKEATSDRFSESLSMALNGAGIQRDRVLERAAILSSRGPPETKSVISDDGAVLSDFLAGRTRLEDRFRRTAAIPDSIGQEDLNNSRILQQRIRSASLTSQRAKRMRSEDDESNL